MVSRFPLRTLALAAVLAVVACDNASRSTEPTALEELAPTFQTAAGTVECVGLLPPGVYDEVVVPPDAICELFDAVIRGNVTVRENAFLEWRRSQAGGNVISDKARFVHVHFGSVRENVSIKETRGHGPVPPYVFPATPAVVVNNVTIGEGNLQIEKMFPGPREGLEILDNVIGKGNIKVEEVVTSATFFWAVARNRVAQNLQVFKNKGPATKIVVRNTVGENLQCFENDPPFIGVSNVGPNFAQQAQGQCGAMPLP